MQTSPASSARRCGLAISFALISLSFCYSQKLDNISARAVGGQIIIEYQLSSVNPRDRYEISVYSSHDNFSTPLALAQGDIGMNVYPGSKRITWEAKNELKNYSGTLTFEVRGRLLAGVLTFDALENARRGKDFDITWKGGISGDPVKLELLDKDGHEVQTIASSTNTGKFTWAIPPKTTKGDYKIQITHQGEKVAANVKIRSKIPFAFKVLPLVVVGGIMPFLIPKDKEELPGPPALPSND